ncbi:hypothetical protein C8T65DRAFT_725181 [Cerioporus squamosus]|nr:hypothetical protein C8T65DRAFT_725181 [Cerioporus squamosus]
MVGILHADHTVVHDIPKGWLCHGWHRNTPRPLGKVRDFNFNFNMSSDADAAAAATIECQVSSSRIALAHAGVTSYTSNYCIVAAVVVFIFDAFITFDRDMACFWNTKWTGASLLFFANKWISITLYVLNLIDLASFVRISCSLFLLAAYPVVVLQVVPGAVLGLSLAPVGANLTPAVVIISRVPLITADILLIYITWTKLSSWAALRDIRFSKRLSLSDILFHGGTIYFIVLFAMNVLHLVCTATAVATNDSGGYSVVSVFIGPITAILISRFLLALQEASQAVVGLDRDDPLHSSRNPWDSTPSFISSLGGFINPDLSARSDDDGFEMELQVPSPPEAGEEEEGRAQAESQAAVSSSSA